MCTISNCDAPVFARGLCRFHYNKDYYARNYKPKGRTPALPKHDTCPICGGEKRRQSEICITCNRTRRQHTAYICAHCGKQFIRSAISHKYCSRECYDAARDEYDVCSVEGCGQPATMRKYGLCRNHYQNARRRGELPGRKCSIEGCERSYWSQGYCAQHYDLWKRNGDPLIRKRSQIGQSTSQGGYHTIASKGAKRIRVHVQVVEQNLGRELGSDEIVHHRNGNKLDNRIENLIVLDNVQHWHITHFVDALRKMTPESLALAIEQAQAESIFPFQL